MGDIRALKILLDEIQDRLYREPFDRQADDQVAILKAIREQLKITNTLCNRISKLETTIEKMRRKKR